MVDQGAEHFSLSFQGALEKEVVGQPRAVRAVVRSVTVAASGLEPAKAPAAVYLFMGPNGTGKTHLAHSLARLLHGNTHHLEVIDCVRMLPHQAPDLGRLLRPHFRYTSAQDNDVQVMAPLSILLLENLDSATPDVAQSLFASLESGHLLLPDGGWGSLQGCLVFMTSTLCGNDVFEARPGLGFAPGTEDLAESEKERIYQICSATALKRWGAEVLSHVDDLIVFHRLRECHLPFILQRLVDGVNEQLAAHDVAVHLDQPAVDFLEARGACFLQHGAWVLRKAFRRFIVYPLADLIHSGRTPAGSRILVRVDAGSSLEFEVVDGAESGERSSDNAESCEIPVEWCDDSTPIRESRLIR